MSTLATPAASATSATVTSASSSHIRTVVTNKPYEKVLADLTNAIAQHKFSLLKDYDVTATLQSKGFQLSNPCHVFELCNGGQAIKLLETDMQFSVVLPCRISVYTCKDGTTKLSAVPFAQLVTLLPEDCVGSSAAKEVGAFVDVALLQIMQEAAASTSTCATDTVTVPPTKPA